MTYNDSIQVTEHGLLYVIHKVELFTEDGFIASLYVRHLSEVDILLKIDEVRECLSIAHKEFLSLSKFSLTSVVLMTPLIKKPEPTARAS